MTRAARAREGGPIERGLWWVLGLARPGVLRYTDDTLMARGLVESLLRRGEFDPDDMAAVWARDARWTRGYGPGTRRVLKRIARGHEWRDGGPAHVLPGGSWGNGAAMRAAPLGLFYAGDPELLDRVAAEASAVTHAHPEGIDGGLLLAHAARLAAAGALSLEEISVRCRTDAFRRRLDEAGALLARPDATPRDLARELGRAVRARDSAVTAVAVYLRHRDGTFDALVDECAAIGGDVDTIAAMAGALFGARHGCGPIRAARGFEPSRGPRGHREPGAGARRRGPLSCAGAHGGRRKYANALVQDL